MVFAAIASLAAGNNEVIGVYYPNYADVDISNVHFQPSNHVFYAFATPNTDGSVPTPSGLSHFSQVVRAGGAKPILSIGGGGNSANFPALVASASSRNTFVNAVKNLVNQNNLAGVDIDWEFPDSSTDFSNYRVLAQQLRNALGSSKIISAAVPGWLSRTSMKPIISESLDFVNLMIYDNVYNDDGRPNAALMGDSASVQAVVSTWLSAGIPAKKLVVGVPFYGYKGMSEMTYKEILPLTKSSSGWKYSFSDTSFTPQLVKGSEKITYDNAKSIAAKAKYTACMNLRGVFSWEVTQDNTNELLAAMSAAYPNGNGDSKNCLKLATGISNLPDYSGDTSSSEDDDN
ncbi:glycoside hydrolase family 18 [Thraustotheca clavata]|uniref:Glycoside hydrolase family 18 n=1 Tax=Thraustotheca clavata TaxID=74557 RepID=A0A1V9Z198_9STRA|nr:glycoside hydrolase family 18 [Thraustotheca clavata]